MQHALIRFLAQLFSKRYFYYLGRILYHISLRMMGIGNYENSRISGELHVLHLINKEFGSKKMVVFDVGSHQGEYARVALSIFPNANLHCFEPMENSFKKLKQNLPSLPNVHLNNLAVSDTIGKLELWDYKNQEGSQHTSAYKNVFNNDFTKKYSVGKISLDFYLKKNKLKAIDFLKIDVEGQEYQVLDGLNNYLSKTQFIQFEFNYMNVYSGHFFRDFYQLLNKEFDIFRLYPNQLLPIKKYDPTQHEIFYFQNILAVNKKLKWQI
ncbi:MAG: FkbM family methyltransferase [Patescibacteria group bacterium]